jgi:hypothetical protein
MYYIPYFLNRNNNISVINCDEISTILIKKYFLIRHNNINNKINIYGIFQNVINLNNLKNTGFILKSREYGSELLELYCDNTIYINNLPTDTLKILSKFSKIDLKFEFILHFYYAIIPNYESYKIATEIGLLNDDISYEDFKKCVKYTCSTFYLNTLKEVNKINVLYNNKYKSIKRDMFKQMENNSLSLYLTILAIILSTTGIIQVVQGFIN